MTFDDIKGAVNDDIRRSAIESRMFELFHDDIKNRRFSELHRLYDAAHITNSMLLEQRRKNQAHLSGFFDSIYIDIAYVLVRELVDNPELMTLFRQLYDKRYPDVKSNIEKIKSRASEGKKEMINEYNKAIKRCFPDNGPRYSGIQKNDLFFLYTYLDDVLWESGVLSLKNMKKDARMWLSERQEGIVEYERSFHKFIYTDSGEEIFSSRMFDKYIERQRKKIATTLNIKEEELNETIKRQLSYGADIESDAEIAIAFLLQGGIPDYVRLSAMHVVQENYGSAIWLNTITGTRNAISGNIGYQPDVDKIIRLYYQARVEIAYRETRDKGEEFLKSTISRECQSPDPLIDYQAICYLYFIDIVYQMFRVMQEQHYANFSWEQITHKNILTRNENVIKDLRRIVKEKDRTIATLNRENRALKEKTWKESSKEQVQQFREEQRLIKTIEQNEKDIEELRARIKTQDEFIELLNADYDEADTSEIVDPSLLQEKRYLFVGYADAFPELKKLFPNSIFVTNDSSPISKIQVDAVVCLIKYMSHSMLYRLKSKTQLQDVPTVYCCGKSINSIFKDMMRLFKI